METENISELLSTVGIEHCKRYGMLDYLNYFRAVIRKKIADFTITETAAKVAVARAEALAYDFFINY